MQRIRSENTQLSVNEIWVTLLKSSVGNNDIDELKNKINIVLKKLTNMVNQNPKISYTFFGEIDFKGLFAYSHCATMFHALSATLPKSINPVGLVLTDECNNPFHFIHSVMIAGNKYFLDAFGLFENIDDIKQRFGRCLITSINHFDPINSQYFEYKEQRSKLIAGDIEVVQHPGEAADSSELYSYELTFHLLNLILKGN